EIAEDVIATERQRLNFEQEDLVPLERWGRDRIRNLLDLWQQRRGAQRAKQLELKVAGFSERLEKLPSKERDVVKSALRKLGSVASLSQEQFDSVGAAILTAWEQGRLHGLIQEIATESDLGSDALIRILTEAEVLTALNMAEVIKTKLEVIRGLERRVRAKEFELAVRDYIAKHPWLISPTWETFKVEKGVDHILREARTKAGIDGEDYKGRID